MHNNPKALLSLAWCVPCVLAFLLIAHLAGGSENAQGLVASSEGLFPGGPPAAKLVRARYLSETNAQGQRTERVFIEWRNIGTKPIVAVRADILTRGGRYNGEIPCSVRGYTLFSATSPDEAVAPGATYSGEPFVFNNTTGVPITGVSVFITAADVQSGPPSLR
jgi:hypothetical protein